MINAHNKKICKKLLIVLLLLTGMFFVKGCGGSESESDGGSTPEIPPETLPPVESQYWYKDSDGDGYASYSALAIYQTERPSGPYYSREELISTIDLERDCNDADVTVHPYAEEVCGNRIDDNCNEVNDEDCIDVKALSNLCSDESEGENTGGGMMGRIFILTSENQKSEWNDNLPKGLIPETHEQIEKVICLGEETTETLETCEYYGTTSVVTRFQYTTEAKCYSALTGDFLEMQTIFGGIPRNCPIFTQLPLIPIYGSHVSIFDLFESFDWGFEFDYFDFVYSSPTGIAAHEQTFYMSKDYTPKICHLDNDGKILSISDEMENEISGLYHDGTNLWAVVRYPDNSGICKFNNEMKVLECFDCNSFYEGVSPCHFEGLTGNGQLFWVINHAWYPAHIDRFDNSWKLEHSFQVLDSDTRSIAYDGAYLWLEANEKLYKCDLDGNVIQSFISPEETVGLTSDGTHLWIASALSKKVYKINLSDWALH